MVKLYNLIKSNKPDDLDIRECFKFGPNALTDIKADWVDNWNRIKPNLFFTENMGLNKIGYIHLVSGWLGTNVILRISIIFEVFTNHQWTNVHLNLVHIGPIN